MAKRTDNCTTFFLKEEGGKILVLLLPMYGGAKLKAPGGGCNEGESLEACCNRESEEEAGLIPLDAECVISIPDKKDCEHFRNFFASMSWVGKLRTTSGEDPNEGLPEWFPVEPDFFTGKDKRLIWTQREGLREAIIWAAKKSEKFYYLAENVGVI